MTDLPFWPLVAALFGVVLVRAQATYWVARLVATGASRGPFAWLVDAAPARRGAALLDRWGLPLVTVSFVVVGLQTVMNAAAGAARVPWWRYTLAMVPGCAAWAFVYATIGFAVLWAVVAAAAWSSWGIAVVSGITAIVLAGVGVVVVRRLAT